LPRGLVQRFFHMRIAVLPAANGPHLVELWGPRELRLSQLQLAIDELTARRLGPR